jgi:uncharacterized protein (UPF0333 family)
MNILTIYNLVLLLLTVIIAYLHYTIFNLKKEVKAVWLQIAVLATATAKQFTKIQEEQDNGKQK